MLCGSLTLACTGAVSAQLSQSNQSSQLHQASSSKEPPKEQKLLGKCTLSDLQKEPYSLWFNKNYDAYTPNTDIVARLKKAVAAEGQALTVKIFFGSWCGGSKQEIPRFLSILRALNVPAENIELIGVDSEDSVYKQSPAHEERGVNVYRVPTFVLTSRSNNKEQHSEKEIGRIVEYPAETFERDMLKILRREPYQANYRSYPQIERWLNEGVLADTNVSAAGLASTLRFQVASEGELNACGYVLMARGQVQEATTIFRTNATLFPNSSNCFHSLAEAYHKANKTALALQWYEKALTLNPQNTKLLDTIVRLKSLAHNGTGGGAGASVGTPSDTANRPQAR